MTSDSISIHGPIGFMAQSSSAVYFSAAGKTAGTYQKNATAVPVRDIQNAINIAYWGEDNRFPQNIEQQMAYCGIGKAALDWKARAIFGAGIIPGIVKDFEDDGTTEIFEPLKRSTNKGVYAFLENRRQFRFCMEYLQDWTWFGNTFPEVILSNDAKNITGFMHQESCDSRYVQMNDQGAINTVVLSKMWGMAASQFAKFDPDKRVLGLMENPKNIGSIDEKYLKKLPCIDMYDPVNSLNAIAEKIKDRKGLKSAILPVNYPSVNKTYYQVPAWDGARLAGWVEIASKIPSLLKTLYNKAFRIKYHIEIPETYFEIKYSREKWAAMKTEEKKAARVKLLKEMDNYLSGEKNALSTFVSFFQVAPHDKTEYGRVKITALEDKVAIDKDILTSSAANTEILTAMQVHPTLFGAGTVGTGQQRTGGSDQREAFLVYNAMLKLEREVVLEPFYLARDFNKWDENIVFRIRDTQLTTLDKNKGTEKVVS